MRRFLTVTLFLLAMSLNAPAEAADWRLIQLTAKSEHAGSKVWGGQFIGLNGQNYDASDFYRSQRPEFSARALFARNPQNRLTWLLPLAVDAGYKAQLYQVTPMLSLGLGAAISLGPMSLVSLRVENLLVAGGAISEQPCYDRFRRRFHCGSGMAWTDYRRTDTDRRGAAGAPALQMRLIRRFSF